MDWQFKVALSLAIFFGVLPFAVKDMPQTLVWAGVGAAILFGLWGLPWAAQKIPTYPGLLLILSCCGVISATAWIIQSIKGVVGLEIGAITTNAEFPAGTIIGGIEFKPQFTQASVIIKNSSQESYEDIRAPRTITARS